MCCKQKNGKMSKMQNDSLSTNPLIWGCPLKIRFHWREHFEWPSLVQNSIYLKRPFQILGNQVSYLGTAPLGFHIGSIFWRREILSEFRRTFIFLLRKQWKTKESAKNAHIQVSNKYKKTPVPRDNLIWARQTLCRWYCLPINYCKTIWDSILLIYCLIAGRSFRLTLENVHSNTRVFWSVVASAFQSLSASNDNLEITNAMEIWPSINPTIYYEVAGKYDIFAYLLALYM